MKKWIFFLAFLIAATPLFAEDFLSRKQVKLGEPVGDFALQDLEGKTVKLSDLKGKTVMLHFWSAKCPFVVRYKDRLQDIAKDYTAKGVAVYGIDSNVNDSLDEIKQVAAERQENYPILLDPGNKVADQFGAITTPHVFIINPEGKLVYEGAVDDQGFSEKKIPKKFYVRDALDAVLAGKEVPEAKTKTAGCTVKRG